VESRRISIVDYFPVGRVDRITKSPIELSFARDFWGKGARRNPTLTSSSVRWRKVGDGCGSLSPGGRKGRVHLLLDFKDPNNVSSNPRWKDGWIRGGGIRSSNRDSPVLHHHHRPDSKHLLHPDSKRLRRARSNRLIGVVQRLDGAKLSKLMTKHRL
jgi:hypothetical protein